MTDELGEIIARYERRKSLPKDLYDPLLPYNTMVEVEKLIAFARWTKWAQMGPVADKRLLEVGCGTGTNLLRFIALGFLPENLVGNELLADRAREARHLLPLATAIVVGDAAELDLQDETFDVVFQSTVFTSILDDAFQQRLADRMWALVRPGGGVLWYDYVYNNPGNPDVRGVPVKRIKALFADRKAKVWRMTLAPPVGRTVTRISRRLYTFLNTIPLLRTHVLCWIRKDQCRSD
jgi:SAM-dependent methyltransferase